MFQKILVPLDGSTVAEAAIEFARRFAELSGGSVVLARVAGDGGRTVPTPGEKASSASDQAMEYLRGVAAARSSSPVQFQFQVGSGNATGEILSVAVDVGADLIVLTTRGRSGLARTVLGSTADRVIRAASIPVLALPVRALKARASPIPAWHRVLVPLDGSQLGEQALAFASKLATSLGIGLVLVKVVPPPHAPELEAMRPDGARPPYTSARAAADAGTYLEGVAKRHKLKKGAFELKIEIGQPVDSLASLASGDSIIVMTSRGLSGLERMLMGSVASGVLHEASSPIVFVPLQD